VIVDPIGFVDEHAVFRNRIVSNNSLFGDPTSQEGVAGSAGESPGIVEELDPNDLSNEELMTFPSRIAGYSLVTKDAGLFQVDGFNQIIWNSEPAENLRKSSQNMENILRIVSGFSFLTSQFGYENKGKGLTFLLYGPSGVGKTLTAGKSGMIRTSSVF